MVPKGYVDTGLAAKVNKSELSTIITKNYVDAELDKKLNISGGVMTGNLDMGAKHINNVSTPSTNLQVANKVYVDLTSLSVLGDNKMLADLDLNNNKITNVKTPTSNSDAATKQYVDLKAGSLNHSSGNLDMKDHKIVNLKEPTADTDATSKKDVDSAIRISDTKLLSSTETNAVEFLMDSLSLWGAEEFTKDLKFVDKDLGIMKFNHKVLEFQIQKRERPEAPGSYEYYGELSFNCEDLSHGAYTFSLNWFNTWSRDDDDSLVVQSPSLNINKTTLLNHGLDGGYDVKPSKFNEFIIQTTKYSNSGLVELFLKYTPPPKFTVNEWETNYLVIYAVTGTVDEINKKVYDSLIYYENKTIRFAEDVNMDGSRIENVKIDNDNCVVDLTTLKRYMNMAGTIGYINLFKEFIDLTNPNNFSLSNVQGIIHIDFVKPGLLTNNLPIEDYTKDGMNIHGSRLILGKQYDEDDDFCIFISFKHSSTLTSYSNSYVGFTQSNSSSTVGYTRFHIDATSYTIESSRSSYSLNPIETRNQNKDMVLWISKDGPNYHMHLSIHTSGITFQVPNRHAFSTNQLKIDLPFIIKRIGFDDKRSAVGSIHYFQTILLERQRGII